MSTHLVPRKKREISVLMTTSHLFHVVKGEVSVVAEVTTDLQPKSIDPINKSTLSRDRNIIIIPRLKRVKGKDVVVEEVLDSCLAPKSSLRHLPNNNNNHRKTPLNASVSLGKIASKRGVVSVDIFMMNPNPQLKNRIS